MLETEFFKECFDRYITFYFSHVSTAPHHSFINLAVALKPVKLLRIKKK